MAKTQQIAPVIAPAAPRPGPIAGRVTPEVSPIAPDTSAGDTSMPTPGHHYIRRHYVNGELVS